MTLRDGKVGEVQSVSKAVGSSCLLCKHFHISRKQVPTDALEWKVRLTCTERTGKVREYLTYKERDVCTMTGSYRSSRLGVEREGAVRGRITVLGVGLGREKETGIGLNEC